MKDQARNIWIVVADGARSRILLNRHRDEGVTELPFANKHEPRLASHQSEQAGGVHHKPQFKPTEEKRRETRYVDVLAETLQTGVARKECDGLLLVAPATVLGQLRNALNVQTLKAIVGEVVHDYTHQDNKFVYQHVKDQLPI
jgi:protein required for attachment to host cells